MKEFIKVFLDFLSAIIKILSVYFLIWFIFYLFFQYILLWFFWKIIIPENEWKYEKITYIESLERWNNVNGNFILWFWYVETEIVFYAYEKIWNNQYKLITIPNVTIEEDNSQTPQYIEWKSCTYCQEYKKIIVPIWTIKKQFNG